MVSLNQPLIDAVKQNPDNTAFGKIVKFITENIIDEKYNE